MLDISTLFTAIITSLRTEIWRFAVGDRAAIFNVAHSRLGRAVVRFAALFARWRSGTLPLPRAARVGRVRGARVWVAFPSRRGWLADGRSEVCCFAGQLNHLLSGPQVAEFLAAVPRAGRILRPVCHMLAIDLPQLLRLPPRPLRLRPSRAKPPVPSGGTPDRPLPANIRAAVRAWCVRHV